MRLAKEVEDRKEEMEPTYDESQEEIIYSDHGLALVTTEILILCKVKMTIVLTQHLPYPLCHVWQNLKCYHWIALLKLWFQGDDWQVQSQVGIA